VWWIAWLIVAVALGVAEAFSLTLAFGIFSAAALVAAVVAGAGAPWMFQLLAFAAAAMAGLLVVRPIALRHASQPALTRDGTDALIGRTATVLEEITAEHGLIKLSGEQWSARPLDDHLVIPADAAVEVMEIQGATAIVYPSDLLP